MAKEKRPAKREEEDGDFSDAADKWDGWDRMNKMADDEDAPQEGVEVEEDGEDVEQDDEENEDDEELEEDDDESDGEEDGSEVEGELKEIQNPADAITTEDGRTYTWEVSKNDDLTYDLANLYAYDGAPIDPKEYKYGRHHDGVMFSANPELYIKQHARDDIQLLVNKVFQLPTHSNDIDVFVTLPETTYQIPRAKPAPKIKPPSKWEEFRRQKGIKKVKRSRMVFDETVKDWKPRWGYKKANDEMAAPIIEHKSNVPAGSDPWEVMKKDKKERVQKNRKSQEANVKRAKAQGYAPTVAISADRRDKQALKDAVKQVQKSSASMGKFDKAVEGEPDKARGKKRQFDAVISDPSKEREKQLKILRTIMPHEGSVSVKKAVSFIEKKKSANKHDGSGSKHIDSGHSHQKEVRVNRNVPKTERRKIKSKARESRHA